MENLNPCPAQSRLVVKLHCVKRNYFRNISGLYSPAFGLNTEIYGVNFRIQSECRKIQARKTPSMDTFYEGLICCIALEVLFVCLNLLHSSHNNL